MESIDIVDKQGRATRKFFRSSEFISK